MVLLASRLIGWPLTDDVVWYGMLGAEGDTSVSKSLVMRTQVQIIPAMTR